MIETQLNTIRHYSTISEGFAPAAGPLLVGCCLGGCWGSQSGHQGIMFIDAKIVRHSCNAVENIIETHSNEYPKVIRMVPRGALELPFGSPGESGHPFWVYEGPMWSKVPPRSIYG